jgi:hypothetical protein
MGTLLMESHPFRDTFVAARLNTLETIFFGENRAEACSGGSTWRRGRSSRVSKGSLAGLPKATGSKEPLLKLSFRFIKDQEHGPPGMRYSSPYIGFPNQGLCSGNCGAIRRQFAQHRAHAFPHGCGTCALDSSSGIKPNEVHQAVFTRLRS